MFRRHCMKGILAVLILAGMIGFSPAPAHAAGGSHILLLLDGIHGDSRNPDYPHAIEITSFSFGAANPLTTVGGSTPKVGKAQFSEFSLSKSFDSASLPLLKELASGKTIANGSLVFLGASGPEDKAMPYLIIRLKNIRVTGDSYAMSDGVEAPLESLSLNASQLTFIYEQANSKEPPVTLKIDTEKGTVH